MSGDLHWFDELKHHLLRTVLAGADAKNIALIFHRSEEVEHAAIMFRLMADSMEADVFKEKELARNRYIPAAIRAAVYERDGERCCYCGNVEGPFHLDHKVPVVQGGAPTLDNLCVACETCNLSKGGRTHGQWVSE